MGVLVFYQTKPALTGENLPTEAIDQANEAVETMQQEQDALNDLEQKVRWSKVPTICRNNVAGRVA